VTAAEQTFIFTCIFIRVEQARKLLINSIADVNNLNQVQAVELI
jgi:hypothetical protein